MKGILTSMLVVVMMVLVSCRGGSNGKDSADVAEDQNEKMLSSQLDDDAEFAVDAADGGLLEIELGRLAEGSAASPEVKAFGRMMAEDHGKASTQLKRIAEQANIVLPQVMSRDNQRKYDKLKGKSGADFDKTYMDMMVEEHRDDVEDFEEQAREGRIEVLKQWASTNVPVLQQHLQEAERLRESVRSKR